MINNNIALYATKLALELLKDLFFFPLWWYSYGFFELVRKLVRFLGNKLKSLALIVWIKNIFVPMYGQYDFMGHVISFIVRFFQILIRSIIMTLWLCLAIAILLSWLLLPVLVIYEIIFQIYL